MNTRLLAGLGAAFLLLSTSLMVPPTADAARGGARISIPRSGGISRPAPSARPRSNPAPRPNQEYRPSKPAASPTKPAASRGTAAANPGTPWGGMLRNIGLLAGGMMIGGLLSSLFGFGGSGFLADLLGLLTNVLLIYAGIRLLLWLIAKFRGRDADRSPYQSASRVSYGTAASPASQDAGTYDAAPIPDIHPPRANGKGGTNYDPRRTADWYRQH